MDLHPLDPLGLARPDPVDAGWARRLHSEPRSVGEVLRSASDAMDRQDEAEEQARDPVAYARAWRRKHNLWSRLSGR